MQSFLSLAYSKRKFLLMVFSNLIVQLGITYYIMEHVNVSVYEKIGFLLSLILQLAIIYVMFIVPNPIIKFILFSMFSLITGLHLTYLKKTYDKEAIKAAVESALGIFGAMFVFGVALVIFGVKFGPKVGIFLLLSLFILIIARLISIITNTANRLLSLISVILFSAFVVYETNLILRRNYYGDFIMASFSYYIDILNLFIGSLDK